jgi:hypothetical protein
MNRLQAELQRLFPPDESGVRAMVLTLAQPDSWAHLSKVWQGVQAELELPAPAIAVSGTDSYQLWFSLAQPVEVGPAMAFLEGARMRYLAQVPPDRIRMNTHHAAAPGHPPEVMPPVERLPGQWAAFVTHDLAAVFEDSPWLDLPPGDDAQAELLSRLASIKPEAFDRALARLAQAHATAQHPRPQASAGTPAHGGGYAGNQDPKRFLLDVMNDTSVELHLRIEAARALLPYFEGRQP